MSFHSKDTTMISCAESKVYNHEFSDIKVAVIPNDTSHNVFNLQIKPKGKKMKEYYDLTKVQVKDTLTYFIDNDFYMKMIINGL